MTATGSSVTSFDDRPEQGDGRGAGETPGPSSVRIPGSQRAILVRGRGSNPAAR